MSKQFIRTDSTRYLKLGKKRRSKQVWRLAKGKHSKIRRMRKGYPLMPSVGFKTPRKDAGKINNLIPILVNNVAEISGLDKKSCALISKKVGARKKIEIMKKAQELNIVILNSK